MISLQRLVQVCDDGVLLPEIEEVEANDVFSQNDRYRLITIVWVCALGH